MSDSLSGRCLDRAVAEVLGWTGIKQLAEPWGWFGIEPAMPGGWLSLPAFSAADGPMSQMLAWLRSHGWTLQIIQRVEPHIPWRCIASGHGWRLPMGDGETINEAVSRVVAVAAQETTPASHKPVPQGGV